MMTLKEDNVGEFREVEYGNWFTYRETTNPWALENGLQHEVDVLEGVRYANVLKTVCKIAIDENPDGTPYVVSWKIIKHHKYNDVNFG